MDEGTVSTENENEKTTAQNLAEMLWIRMYPPHKRQGIPLQIMSTPFFISFLKQIITISTYYTDNWWKSPESLDYFRVDPKKHWEYNGVANSTGMGAVLLKIVIGIKIVYAFALFRFLGRSFWFVSFLHRNSGGLCPRCFFIFIDRSILLGKEGSPMWHVRAKIWQRSEGQNTTTFVWKEFV